jgi:hypothetical protein
MHARWAGRSRKQAVSVALKIDIRLITSEPNELLQSLPVAADVPFDAYHRQHDPTCLPDTRADLLQEI